MSHSSEMRGMLGLLSRLSCLFQFGSAAVWVLLHVSLVLTAKHNSFTNTPSTFPTWDNSFQTTQTCLDSIPTQGSLSLQPGSVIIISLSYLSVHLLVCRFFCVLVWPILNNTVVSFCAAAVLFTAAVISQSLDLELDYGGYFPTRHLDVNTLMNFTLNSDLKNRLHWKVGIFLAHFWSTGHHFL